GGVEGGAKELGLGGAARGGPHIYGREGMPAPAEAEKPMPERRHPDPARLFGRPVRVNRVKTLYHRLQQPVRVVLDAAVAGEPGAVLHLMGASCDRPTLAVVKRGPRGRGPDVERDDH